MGTINPKVSDVVITISYAELIQYSREMVDKTFPDEEFKLVDVEDDDDGIHFRFSKVDALDLVLSDAQDGLHDIYEEGGNEAGFSDMDSPSDDEPSS